MRQPGRDKGHEALLRALPEVARQVPEVLLVVVGRGSDETRLRRLADEQGMAGHVDFAGLVPDAELPAFYESCDVFAMPSSGEGFGLVYLEAMYHARPCIGGNRDAAGEVVLDGQTGLLVEPGNAPALARALLTLLQDRALATRFGKAGRERLDQHFTYDHFARRFQHALTRLEPVV